ncbi:unnamed protein product [Rotaria sp. Silwood1]|nr:unnamed protein product [Rotaria sp. Silwood1]CAF3354321.1 unnamed protein product [Rotaria sp. Silwood1]CAF3377841.1 unnamed protein product [Rotaria sp. Silwood1]CAF4659829.1 unnamed protein product [Rotaria sp. Silwood1]
MASSATGDTATIAKEIKAQLKQARELINQKDHTGALKLCEAIIKKDKTCYTGWIMIAACAQELKQFHQAHAALNKAFELDENQSLAYQGMIQLGERAPGFLSESDVSSAYRKLCSLTRASDPIKFFDHAKKYIEYLKKQIECQSTTTNEQNNPYRIQLAELCKDIVEEKRLQLSQDDERVYRLLSTDILSSIKTLPTNLNEFLSSNYFWLSQSSSDNIQRLNYYEKYIKSICQMGRSNSDIIDYCNECLTLFPNSTVAQNTIIIIVLETLLPQIYDSLAPVAKLTDALNRIRSDENNQTSAPSICGKAYFLMRNGKYSTALESLLNLNLEDDGHHLVVILKMVCYAHLHIIKETIDMTSIARTKLTNFIVKDVVSSIESLIDLCLAMITYDQGQHEKSIQIFDKVRNVPNKFHDRAVYGQFNAYINMNKSTDARACYEIIKDNLDPSQELSCRLQLALIEDYPSELLKIVQAALKEANDNEELFELTVQGWLSVGQAYLSIQRSNDMFDKEQCKYAFTKAIELDEYFWESYACLSRYYNEIEQSLSEALAYSKRAFELNENIESVQINYVDNLLQAEQIYDALEILERILAMNNTKTWAHFRYGLVSLRINNVYNAVKALQIVSRRPPVSGASWSALGDAHLHTNNLKTALSCYSKATSLERETLYSLTRQAFTMTLLSRYNEAISLFDKVIDQSPKYILARKGKGEAHFYLAIQQIGLYKDQLAVFHVQQSLKAFHDALCLQSDYACLWKKYGDACMLLHPINDDLIHIRLPSLTKKFDENKIKDVDGCIILKKIDLLQRAQKCFMQAIRLNSRSAVYWSCLAQCVYIQARYNSDDQRLLMMALEYMKVAISLKPNDHLLWNALGVVAAHPALNESGFAQHCFFKSLQLQRSAIVYTNLGFLYYRHENIQLANNAFSKAQQTDPMYSLAWIGQALIAEKIDYNESIDLYRHCVDLSNHSQGLYGYGKVIAHLLIKPTNKSSDIYRYSIDYLNGNQRAADALTKYIQRNPKDVNALQCLGIIHEFNQRFTQAANAYQLSLTHMNQQSEVSKMIRNDYARVKCRSGDVQLDAFILQDNKITLLDVLWLAIAYGKMNKQTDAIEILKRVIDDSTTSNKDRSILLTFLGLYQRKIDPQTAVKNLFKSYSTKPVCSSAVTSLCAMGMIISDNRITTAALKEMPKLTDSNYTMDIHLLTCLSMFLTNKTREVYTYTMNAVHNYPWLTWTWILTLIARVQLGNSSGVLQIIEGICHSSFSTIDENMAILVAKVFHHISHEHNEYILHLFQMLIMHRPALLDLRVSLAQYIQSFDQSFGQSLLPKTTSL